MPHGSLRPDVIHVQHNGQIKLKYITSISSKSSKKSGATSSKMSELMYQSPELVTDWQSDLRISDDIYALGILILEVRLPS